MIKSDVRMRVLKFGGTSVANPERLKAVSKIIEGRFHEDGATIAVVSAFSGMTDLLLSAINEAQKNQETYKLLLSQFTNKAHNIAIELLSPDIYDKIKIELNQNHEKLRDLLVGVFLIQEASNKSCDLAMSFGERNCAFILASYLKSKGLPVEYIDASNYIKTENIYNTAQVNFELTNQLINAKLDAQNNISIVTGFIGSDIKTGIVTTLGRGGSDYTAAIFAAGLRSSALEIWTDVDGVLTSDPRKVKNAYPIKELSYLEAAELSHFGAKVLYAPTIRPVKDLKIPTWIKNTFNPEAKGTLIHDGSKENRNIITGISAIDNIALISIEGSGMQGVPGIAFRFFKSLAMGHINIIMITQASSEHSICVAIKSTFIDKAKEFINKAFSFEIERQLINPLKIVDNLSLLAIVGENMKNTPGVAGRLFQTLGKNGINIEAIAQGSSELNITFAVHQKDEIKALNCIHDAFFLSDYKTVHLFIVGVGLIGSTLLQLIHENRKKIKNDNGIYFVLNGLSNSRNMVLSKEGLTGAIKNELIESSQTADIEEFISKMVSYNFPNSIFVDNTASKIIPEHYEVILKNNIGISTPNKIALSSGLQRYKSLKALSGVSNIPLNFETNVGAGLPIISTIKSLMDSGDKILKVEAVLSGSVSYIFNNFNAQVLFSDIVKQAQDKGLTEPDPREDLSGSDVKRKLLILSRECGFDVEPIDITIENVLSAETLNQPSVEEFYKSLSSDNIRFQELAKLAESKNCRLRFIASFTEGRGKIGLQFVTADNPFFNLSGSDNMLVLYSNRYNETPLVIQGPGAGSVVTAAGVLAELINMSLSL